MSRGSRRGTRRGGGDARGYHRGGSNLRAYNERARAILSRHNVQTIITNLECPIALCVGMMYTVCMDTITRVYDLTTWVALTTLIAYVALL
jgi:hypothetical protein